MTEPDITAAIADLNARHADERTRERDEAIADRAILVGQLQSARATAARAQAVIAEVRDIRDSLIGLGDDTTEAEDALAEVIDAYDATTPPPSSVPGPRAQETDLIDLIADAIPQPPSESGCDHHEPDSPLRGVLQCHRCEARRVLAALEAAGRLAGDTTPPDAPLARIDADGEIWHPQPDGRWLYSGDINIVAPLPELEADSGPTRLVRLVPVPAEPTSPADTGEAS